MAEAIRLVIWDLDETFWKGTITEGGITEYLRANHDIVVELAQRGIISSICSKNEKTKVLSILEEHGISQYFVFPSISWEPKGPRLIDLIEAVQLRPPTIMFIDDNPSNRAEAREMVPGLQVESDSFIPSILSDPRFAGKPDPALSRLQQYKLLEARKEDEVRSVGSNEEFLRGCDVRVYVEYDVVSYLDRAIELINRTNQLNFTKRRLPEDIAQARQLLLADVGDHRRQSGLIRVIDRYGDYGFVGFFMLENGGLDQSRTRLGQTLLHYCFSCRTLGMFVEYWFYNWLHRPRINVSGEVLTDLTLPRTVDWIRLISAVDGNESRTMRIAPEIRVHGGCEAASIAHYLAAYSDNVVVSGNFHAGAQFIRVNSAPLLLSACDRVGPEFQRESNLLRIPYEPMVSRYFVDVPEGTAFVFGGQYDAPGPSRYRHKVHGWEIRLEPHGFHAVIIAKSSEEELRGILDGLNVGKDVKSEITDVVLHIHENYESASYPDDKKLAECMRDIFGRVPHGSRIVLLLDHDKVRDHTGALKDAPWNRHYTDQIRRLAGACPFAGTVSFSDFILDENEIRGGGNHYDRMVYYRMAEGIVSLLRNLPAKEARQSAPSCNVLALS